MKSSPAFKETILNYLEERASTDVLFAAAYTKETKNIDDCIIYILNYVQKSEINGYTDSEIYSLALHYYQEDTIDIGSPVECHVIVNHKVELTEEEIAEAKKNAVEKIQNDAYRRMHQKKAPVKPTVTPVPQQTLFG